VKTERKTQFEWKQIKFAYSVTSANTRYNGFGQLA